MIKNGIFPTSTCPFWRCLLCKLFKHWAAKRRNLKDMIDISVFFNIGPCDRYLFQFDFFEKKIIHSHYNFSKVSITSLIIVSFFFWDPRSQLTSQNIFGKFRLAHLFMICSNFKTVSL